MMVIGEEITVGTCTGDEKIKRRAQATICGVERATRGTAAEAVVGIEKREGKGCECNLTCRARINTRDVNRIGELNWGGRT